MNVYHIILCQLTKYASDLSKGTPEMSVTKTWLGSVIQLRTHT